MANKQTAKDAYENQMNIVYQQKANGKNEWWTYVDGEIRYLSVDEAMLLMSTNAKFVPVR